MNSKYANMYEDSCNFSFDIYSKNIEPMVNYIREKYPIENIVLKIQQTKKKNYLIN